VGLLPPAWPKCSYGHAKKVVPSVHALPTAVTSHNIVMSYPFVYELLDCLYLGVVQGGEFASFVSLGVT
jgi:hypothetical protein